MTDYFKYDVHFVMNITDIDDKVCHETCFVEANLAVGRGRWHTTTSSKVESDHKTQEAMLAE